MKDLDEIKPKIEKHEEVNKQNELRYVGQSRKPHKGLTLFQFNGKTGELLAAVYQKSVHVNEKGEPVKVNKLQTEKNCIYFWALNEGSAAKKLFKQGLIKSTQVKK